MLGLLHSKSLLNASGFSYSPLVLLILSAWIVLIPSASDCKHLEDFSSPPQGTQVGWASYYGRGFHGKKTSSGETFNNHEMMAAHPSHPIGTLVRVTNLKNKNAVEVRIADRGPTRIIRAKGVIIDLSLAAATKLGMIKDGRTRVKVEVLEWGGNPRK